MSRAFRKQLFKIVNLFEEANKVLDKLLPYAGGREAEITGLLTDCQDGAVSIGNSIEALYGEGTESVKRLEEYCENLYQLALSLGNVVKRKELLKLLKIRVKKLRKVIGEDVPDKLEVVFLPYKASMWDSLESVWMAARDDEEAEAFVIPIPYYDKNPDGSFREMHYEGDMYPDYVSVTRYQEYNFELRQPDIIFIHNPYDECNHVTSVHPFFYSKNLKKFTGQLVYIPYFILDGQGMTESLALLPGVFNADKVIVQNDREKEDYIRYFQNTYPMIKIADKFHSAGSPKSDKIRLVSGTNISSPPEWIDKIKDRKVIFYNTSLNALLNGNKIYLSKMNEVFTFFRNRDDLLLLWRPHPLMEATLSSMREDLYQRYLYLKTIFIEENIGIYDDTPDMYNAIGISDGYYGDMSSVVWLYQATGKLIMIQSLVNNSEKCSNRSQEEIENDER